MLSSFSEIFNHAMHYGNVSGTKTNKLNICERLEENTLLHILFPLKLITLILYLDHQINLKHLVLS